MGVRQFSLGGLKFFIGGGQGEFQHQAAEYVTVFIYMQSKHLLLCLAWIAYGNHIKNTKIC